MSNLVFLEAVSQSGDADALVEENSQLIDFAVREIDSLVEEQANYTASNVGHFIENDFQGTYDTVSDPVSNVVIEASTMFSNIISSNISTSDKVMMIEATAHSINMRDAALFENLPDMISTGIKNMKDYYGAGGAKHLLGDTADAVNKHLIQPGVKNATDYYSTGVASRAAAEAAKAAGNAASAVGHAASVGLSKAYNAINPPVPPVPPAPLTLGEKASKYANSAIDSVKTAASNLKGSADGVLGGMSKTQASAAGAAAGAAGGAAGGGAIGAAGGLVKLFSKERKAWKSLVKQEKLAMKKGANQATLAKIHAAKSKARAEYIKSRNAAVKKGAKIGAGIGGVGGAIAGGMYGHGKGLVDQGDAASLNIPTLRIPSFKNPYPDPTIA